MFVSSCNNLFLCHVILCFYNLFSNKHKNIKKFALNVLQLKSQLLSNDANLANTTNKSRKTTKKINFDI